MNTLLRDVSDNCSQPLHVINSFFLIENMFLVLRPDITLCCMHIEHLQPTPCGLDYKEMNLVLRHQCKNAQVTKVGGNSMRANVRQEMFLSDN